MTEVTRPNETNLSTDSHATKVTSLSLQHGGGGREVGVGDPNTLLLDLHGGGEKCVWET